MDAERGREVLEEQGCVACHGIRTDGGAGRDLAEPLLDKYTSAGMAATLWNHLPEMWSVIGQGEARPEPSEQDAEDLFAYLYSLRFFDRAGLFTRGERDFETKNCAGCHSLGTPAVGPGKPVSLWKDIVRDPFQLVQEMWNHSSAMGGAVREEQVQWKRLNARDLADISAYVLAVQGRTPSRVAPSFSLPDTSGGAELFAANCGGCHPAPVRLDDRLQNDTLTDIAAGIWNHLSRLEATPQVSREDMQTIVAYLWERAYQQPEGEAARGAKVFEQKRCATCHSGAGQQLVPQAGGTYSPFTLISLWFRHGPEMEGAMRDLGIRWPKLSERDVADLTAYFNSGLE